MADNMQHDYFDGDDLPEPKPAEETPREREERELKELVVVSPTDYYRRVALAVTAVVVLLTVLAVYLCFFHTTVSQAEVTGRLMTVRCEGVVFKTYEASMVSEQYITDSIKRQQDDFSFSVENDSLAKVMMREQNSGKQVRVTYKKYMVPLPWRGSSTVIATGFARTDTLTSGPEPNE